MAYSEPLTFGKLQREQRAWVEHNFPGRESWNPLVGAMEELGELAHAHLKQHQNIRVGENHEANGKDAVADIVIFLSDYCSARGWDFQHIMEITWNQVKHRDWQKNRETAHLDGE